MGIRVVGQNREIVVEAVFGSQQEAVVRSRVAIVILGDG